MPRMIARILFLLVSATATLLAWDPAHAQTRDKPVGVGEAAPDFTLTDQSGRQHTLSAQRGKRPVILVFYRGHW
jgi:cytochrome oxidase Cu insertion factor (SCO1/SenC/PrrC family)